MVVGPLFMLLSSLLCNRYGIIAGGVLS